MALLTSWGTPEPPVQETGPCTYKCLVRGNTKIAKDFCEQVSPNSTSSFIYPYAHGPLDFHLHIARLLSQSTPFFGAHMDLILYNGKESGDIVPRMTNLIREHQHLAPAGCRTIVVGVFDSDDDVCPDDEKYENFKRSFLSVRFMRIVASTEAFRNLARAVFEDLDFCGTPSPTIPEDSSNDSGDEELSDPPSPPRGEHNPDLEDAGSPDVRPEECSIL